MVRQAKIYIGNAAEFKPENYFEVPGVTVSDEGDVFDSTGEKMETEKKKGYKCVRVMINGKEKLCKVHRIVACSFQDICGEFNQVVNHLDEDKFNNRASNLRWTTVKENNTWGTVMERRRKTLETTSMVKDIVKDYYIKNHIMYYSRNIKITKLKYEYKVVDKNNSITLYIPFSKVEEKMNPKHIDEPKPVVEQKLIIEQEPTIEQETIIVEAKETTPVPENDFDYDEYKIAYLNICRLMEKFHIE